jgi:hypothetical protein
VATNRFFKDADIKNFEQRVSDRVGMTTGLDLVQSFGEAGEGKTMRAMLAPSETDSTSKNENIGSIIADLRTSFENKLRAISLPASVVLLSASAELARDPRVPSVRLTYLADDRTAEGARALLPGWLERELGLPPGGVHLTYTAAHYCFEVSPRGDLSKADLSRLGEIRDLLRLYPPLQAKIDLPARTGE